MIAVYILAVCVLLHAAVTGYYLRRISARLNRLPPRVTGHGADGAITYYAKDEP